MSNAASFAKIAESPVGIALVIGVGALAFWLIHDKLVGDIKDAAGAVGDGISGVAEGVGGVITGRNTVTEDTPYEGYGVVGTIAAGEDALAGGLFSNIGSWLGGHIYDWSHDESSASIQSTTGNPLSPSGPNATYREAANNSPVNAQYAASPLSYDLGRFITPQALY